jgi:triphosphatase
LVDAPYETELKLRVAPRVARKLPAHPAILDLKHGRVRKARLRSVYFDTPDFRLARAGVSVRLRHAGRDWLQTAKGGATNDTAGGLAQRIECEWRLGASRTRPPLDHAKLASTPFRHAIEKATRDALLRPVFVTRFERTTVPVRFDDGTLATVCIDIGSIHAADDASQARKAPVAEVEIELASGDAARLFELAMKLADDVPMGVETRSKAARGYALLQAEPERVATAQPLDYPAEATAASAFATILRNCLQHIEVNAEALSRGPDVEAVHQMRVGVRRMRAATALLQRAVEDTTLPSLADDLRWLGDVLGEVRDLDVFGSQTLAALGAASQRLHDTDAALAASIDELRDLAATQANVARSNARAALASPRYVKLILGLGHLATTLAATGPERRQPAVLSQPARAFASQCLARRHRKLRRAAKELATSSTEQRHALRVQAKKMRYASEFFAPLFGTKRTRRYVAALVALQRELGAANDASVAARMASRLAPGRSSAAVVAGWTSAHGSDAKRIERLWRDVARAKRFWDQEARDRDATVL